MANQIFYRTNNIGNLNNLINNNNDGLDKKPDIYLAQLLTDKKSLSALPNVFTHVEKLLDDEINKVRGNLFHQPSNHGQNELPEPYGPILTLMEKLPVPVSTYPDFNFVGRILGPKGYTAKILEQETGCKIMVRGKGSMRDKEKEERNKDKPNWEHLREELHVLITCEDVESRAKFKMARAIEEVQKLLIPAADADDELKKMQLMELAIMKGTYKDNAIAVITSQQGTRLIATPISLPSMPQCMLRAPTMGIQQAVNTPLFFSTPRAFQPIHASPYAATLSPLSAAASPAPVIQSQTPLMANQGIVDSQQNIIYQYTPFYASNGTALIDYAAAYEGANTTGKIHTPMLLRTHPHPYSR